MILWTFFAVAFMGAGVAWSLLSPPTSIARMHAKAMLTPANLVEVALTERAPASTQPQFSTLAIDDKGTQAVDVQLPCEGNGRFAKNVAQVRLTGQLCNPAGKKDLREIASSEITNTTNGFSATVFYPKSNAFTTDYMTLAAGSNHIRILHILKSGARIEREFLIERH